MFIKQTLKTQKSWRNEKLCIKMRSITIFLIWQRGFSCKLYTWSFLGVPSFIITEYVWQVSWRKVFATPAPSPTHLWATQKSPSLTGLIIVLQKYVFGKLLFFYFMGTNYLRTLFKQKFLYLLFSGDAHMNKPIANFLFDQRIS